MTEGKVTAEEEVKKWIAAFQKKHKQAPTPFDLAANLASGAKDSDAMSAMVAFMEANAEEQKK